MISFLIRRNLCITKCHANIKCLLYVKVNYKLGGSYINSPDWIENKKAKINPDSKIINVLSMQQLLHYVITILSIIQKESQILIHL